MDYGERKCTMKSKLKIFAAIACVATLCLALVGCGGDKSAEWKKAVVGTWEVTEITGTSQDDIDMMKAFGLNVELYSRTMIPSRSACSARPLTAPGKQPPPTRSF